MRKQNETITVRCTETERQQIFAVKPIRQNSSAETYLYEDKKLTVRGCAYKVTLLFPMPGSGAETVEAKLRYLINGRKE